MSLMNLIDDLPSEEQKGKRNNNKFSFRAEGANSEASYGG
jgi:hypothetical protein